MNTKQETEVFNCEKCKNEFPGIGSLKKHLRKVHEVWDPAIEENSKFFNLVNTFVFCENKKVIWKP